MTERAHIIDIDHLVVDPAASRMPGGLEAAIGAEVARALHGRGAAAPALVARVPGIASAVASRVADATAGGSAVVR